MTQCVCSQECVDETCLCHNFFLNLIHIYSKRNTDSYSFIYFSLLPPSSIPSPHPHTAHYTRITGHVCSSCVTGVPKCSSRMAWVHSVNTQCHHVVSVGSSFSQTSTNLGNSHAKKSEKSTCSRQNENIVNVLNHLFCHQQINNQQAVCAWGAGVYQSCSHLMGFDKSHQSMFSVCVSVCMRERERH